jgi:hypothetical protein
MESMDGRMTWSISGQTGKLPVSKTPKFAAVKSSRERVSRSSPSFPVKNSLTDR